MRRAVFALAAAALAIVVACTATLEDGVYACDGDGSCPDGWFCRGDDRCYRSAAPLYAPCAEDADCLSNFCHRGPDPDAPTGTCSVTCAGACPTMEGVTGACASGGCLAECDGTCDAPFECFHAPGFPGRACFEVEDPVYDSRRGCDGGAPGCAAPILCARATSVDTLGVCGWPCAMPGADACPLGAVCVDLPAQVAAASMTGALCLAPCAQPGDCLGGLVCAPFPGAQSHCVPQGWADL